MMNNQVDAFLEYLNYFENIVPAFFSVFSIFCLSTVYLDQIKINLDYAHEIRSLVKDQEVYNGVQTGVDTKLATVSSFLSNS